MMKILQHRTNSCPATYEIKGSSRMWHIAPATVSPGRSPARGMTVQELPRMVAADAEVSLPQPRTADDTNASSCPDARCSGARSSCRHSAEDDAGAGLSAAHGDLPVSVSGRRRHRHPHTDAGGG